MRIEVINTGTELMLGGTVNTHLAFIARELFPLGLRVQRQVTVPDGEPIRDALVESFPRADAVIVTGGLGPTSDDLTRELIAELLGRKLIQNQDVLAHIENFFAKRGRPRPAKTSVETFVPEGALVFLNATGTAPGLAMRIDSNEDGGLKMEHGNKFRPPSSVINSPSPRWLVMLPGPPRELRPMFDEQVAPLLKREFAGEIFVCRTLRTTGIGESRVQEFVESGLRPFVERGLEVGYCARPGAVDVRLAAGGADAEKLVAEGEAVVRGILGESIFGHDDEEIEQVVVRLLARQKKTLALAESCTGGLIASRIADVPGASEVFLGGVVSYANPAKEKLLGVLAESLAAHGAVSEAVAREMAAGAREKFGADFALAVTGIAGPGGGSPEKPVGTVFIALASAAGVEAREFLNVWDRATFKQVTATQALEWLRRALSK